MAALRTKTKIQVVDRDINVLFPGFMDDKAISAEFARFARQEFGTAQAQNKTVLGRAPPHETYVDGVKGASEDAVKPDGRIVYEFELLDEMYDWIRAQLEKHSPVGKTDDHRPGHPGLYRATHVLIANGEVIEPGEPVPAAEEAFFVSLVPYARKIERGLSPQAPQGVYEAVAALAQQRFGNFAKIRFSYRSPAIGPIAAWADRTTMASPGRRGAKRTDWLLRQPSVVVSFK
ncbi:MAG TPA: hypothetical protein VM434_18615 [Beijerinckiaceae bacterium]|nr:hypothetical protein [Beijerinckiaceae bacterium]